MAESSSPRQSATVSSGPPPGLCGACRHARLIRTTRGTVFRLCERSATDVRFPRYPALPVIRCAGFEPGDLG